MKRMQYFKYGNPEELSLADVDQPTPGRGQILVQVKAASVNPMDWKIRRGEMKMMSGSHFPRGLGHDFSGVVDAVGLDVKQYKVGDEVFGAATIRQAGAFAEYVVANTKTVALKPSNRAGSVCLNSFRAVAKWIPASVRLPSGLMTAH